jgi:hypothetical protein
MFRNYITCLLLLLAGTGLFAQGEDLLLSRSTLTLTVGLHHGYFKDQNYSPLNYRSGGTRFGLSYGRNTSAGDRWNVGLGAILGKLTPQVEDVEKADRYILDFSFGYLKGLSGNTADRQLHFGGNYRSYVDMVLYDGTEAVTLFGLHGFEVAGAGMWKTGDKTRLKAGASIPVFALLSRPPYSGWDKFIGDNSNNIPKVVTRGNWTSLNNFTGLRANLGYEYDLGDKFSVEARYSLAYYATQRLDPVRILNNEFSVLATLKY